MIDSAASEEEAEDQTEKKRQPAQRKPPARQRAKSKQKSQAAKQPTRRQPRRQAAASTFEEGPASSEDDASGTDPFLSRSLRLASCTCPQGICTMFGGQLASSSKDNAFWLCSLHSFNKTYASQSANLGSTRTLGMQMGHAALPLDVYRPPTFLEIHRPGVASKAIL